MVSDRLRLHLRRKYKIRKRKQINHQQMRKFQISPVNAERRIGIQVKHHHYDSVQLGETDSERFFLSMMDAVNDQLRGGIPTEHERFDTISRFIADHAPRNKLNLIIYDGDLMYVHKNLKNTLCFKRLENGIVFSTKPLDDGIWVPFPMAQVIAYREGQEVYRGERHKGILVPPLDYITVNDAMYI